MKKLIKKTTSVILALVMLMSIAATVAFAEGNVRITSISNTTTGVRVAYSTASDVEAYKFFRKTADTDWTLVMTVTDSTYNYFVDTSAESDNLYSYAISYVVNGVESDKIESDTTIYYLAVPDFTLNLKGNKVLINYEFVDGATGYQILRKSDDTDLVVIGSSTDGTFLDSDVEMNKTYTYAIRSYKEARLSYIRTKSITTYDVPTLANVQTGVKVAYKKVDNAVKYQLYRKSTANGEWVKIKEMSPKTWYYFVDTVAESGNTYYYSVRVITTTGVIENNLDGSSIYYLEAPKMTFESSEDGTVIKFTASAGADTYQILRKAPNAGTYKTIGYSTTTEFVDTKAVDGETYTYAVRPKSSNGGVGYFNYVNYKFSIS